MNPTTCVLILVFVAVRVHVQGAVLKENVKETLFSGWSSRIVGGSQASPSQFPFQASLQSNANTHFCGAFIINNRWVGSAAHCTINRTPDNTRVRVGSIDRTTGGTLFQAAAIRNHPDFNQLDIINDVCTVQTSGIISFSLTVQPIALASNFIGTAAATVSGWGQTSHPGTAPNLLQFINTHTLTNPDCRSRHTAANAALITDTNICAFTQVGQGTCMGDSGGPLVSGGQVIGTVSWGIACAQGRPDVYSRVASFRDWFIANSS
ncbi:Chymotrypsin-2 [Pseudolycoriella hygida]|uniref:Chymotrypsin-2 n=1 Tax=Pseudolycoriella hygida TaxID=35572 RepID=A0A9Q0N7L6_9DIPT|nr:Chymotrypsin-2 [Pseudolycoriella hygida]